MIKTEKQGNFIVVSVTDNGIGIDPGKQQSVFTKYVRIDEAVDGSSIGLYLLNEIVESPAGKITLTSEPGKSSAFQVYLISR